MRAIPDGTVDVGALVGAVIDSDEPVLTLKEPL